MEPEIENNIMNSIPYDVIVKILSYLPATYRKQARLVCSKWYEASNDITILKHQKFMFYKYYKADLNFMFDILRKIDVKYYNLELEGDSDNSCYGLKSVDEHFDSFMESHGSKIHSLCFRDCSISFKTMEKILIHCINLEELIFVQGDYYSNIPPCIPIIDGVQIERRKLKILKFMDCSAWMTDQLLTIFISIYTQLKELVLDDIGMMYNKAEIDRYYKAGRINQPSDCIVSYRNFYQVVSEKCRNIQKLSLAWHSHLDNGLTDDDLTTLATSFKLNELNLINHRDISTDGFKKFLSQQRNLIAVDISNCPYFNFECFKLLFDQNPNLKFLKVVFENYVTFSQVELIKCVENSQLKSFYCDISKCGSIRPEEPFISGKLHTMDKLTSFSFYTLLGHGTFFLSLLQTLRNLTYLDLSYVDLTLNEKKEREKASSFIFIEMIHLETIILKNCLGWISDQSFENSTGRLENLRHLNLSNCRCVTTRGIMNFWYPKLRFLNLSGCNLVDKQVFAHVVKTSPLIEDLEINYSRDMNEKTVQMICENLKFLRRLFMNGNCELATYALHFQSCLSLRCVEIDLKGTCYFFTYNPATGCLNKGIPAEDA